MSNRPKIVSPEHASAYPDRLAVISVGRGRWSVCRGYEFHREFRTHADAIAYADKEARRS